VRTNRTRFPPPAAIAPHPAAPGPARMLVDLELASGDPMDGTNLMPIVAALALASLVIPLLVRLARRSRAAR